MTIDTAYLDGIGDNWIVRTDNDGLGFGLFRWLLAAVIIGPTSIATALANGLLSGLTVYLVLFAVAVITAMMCAQPDMGGFER